jgi:molecular chaperone HscB
MNYFELYNLTVSLSPDKAEVKKKFYELSRKYHPDFFTNENASDQSEALEKSAMVNKAYKVFNNPDETIKYVLQQKNLLVEEEKYALPPAFLMEMMDINEQADDAKVANDPEAATNLRSSILNIQSTLYAPVKHIIEDYKEGITTEKELLQVKDYYYKKKYLNRILEGLS